MYSFFAQYTCRVIKFNALSISTVATSFTKNVHYLYKHAIIYD